MQLNPVQAFGTPEATATLAADVSKEEIQLFSQLGAIGFQRATRNRVCDIEDTLEGFLRAARTAGFPRALLAVEATGSYHEKLLHIARRLGFLTAWVSAEAVAKMRVIETNDTGKTDLKDPRVIHTLARLGKTQRHRVLPEPYALLRQWNGIYEAADLGVVRARCQLHHLLFRLFPDYGFKRDFLYSPSGVALLQRYGCNPYRILAAGRSRFARTIKRSAPRIRATSIARLLEQAQSSLRALPTAPQAALLEMRLHQLWQDYQLHLQRKQQAKTAMEALYEEIRSENPALPTAQKGVVTSFHLSRIFAETGPASDFPSRRKLIRYAGLNLRERQSGQYRGQTKISKKARPLLRKILSQVVLPLVKQNGLYGPYYHRKRQQEKMPGDKAITAVSRLFLKMLYGWSRSRESFNRERVFTCQSQYRKIAA